MNQELSIEELKALIQTTQALVEEQQGRIALLEERLRAMDIPVRANGWAAGMVGLLMGGRRTF